LSLRERIGVRAGCSLIDDPTLCPVASQRTERRRRDGACLLLYSKHASCAVNFGVGVGYRPPSPRPSPGGRGGRPSVIERLRAAEIGEQIADVLVAHLGDDTFRHK